MVTSLTILAPTHNRPEVLALVWPTWIRQEGVKEIVIVNDGSTISYKDVFNDMAAVCESQGIRLKIVEIPKRVGAPAAKNTGLTECTSDEILTTDDDILLPDDMVARCRADRPSVGCPVLVGPRVIYLQNSETHVSALKRAAQEEQPYFDIKKLTLCAWAHPGAVREYPFITAVVIWPADLFRRGLRFFEGYGGNGYREESDPQLKAAQEFGAKVFLTPDAYCFHLPPSVAYARRGGQRRGGIFWFEYWVLRNNYIFLKRHSIYLNKTFGVVAIISWLQLLLSRISLTRLHAVLIKKRR
jgi:glycosyltransferase involved in cell wall biosynthesis